MRPPAVEAGFDYARAIMDLRACMTYEEIADYCGFESKQTIANIVAGRRIPQHPQGEALYILYFETFNRKPPRSLVSVTVHERGQLATT